MGVFWVVQFYSFNLHAKGIAVLHLGYAHAQNGITKTI